MEKINNYNFIVFTQLFRNENATSVLLSNNVGTKRIKEKRVSKIMDFLRFL